MNSKKDNKSEIVKFRITKKEKEKLIYPKENTAGIS